MDLIDDSIDTLLNKHGAGVTGVEQDGSNVRVAFGQRCDTINSLVTSLYDIEKEFVFPEQMGDAMHLVVRKLDERSDTVPTEVLAESKTHSNKMVQYTLYKSALAGVRLRQLFKQLEPDFVPEILEDVPGSNILFLHVSPCQNKRKVLEANTLENELKIEKGMSWTVCLFMLLISIFISIFAAYKAEFFKGLLASYIK